MAAVALLAAYGCSKDDPLSPQDLVGSYTATTFTAGTTNVLSAGGSIAINLAADGRTTGQLFVPASVTGSGDLSVSLAGTYELTGTTVRFTQTEDSFVRDVEFMVVGNTLQGSAVFTLTTITLVLTRTT